MSFAGTCVHSPCVTGERPTRDSFWHRRVVRPVMDQLTQGTSPRELALTVALGAVIGLFPILGTTAIICVGVGAALKLNQAVIQAANFAVTPIHLALILVFVRSGEFLLGAEKMPFHPAQLVSEFQASPAAFMAKFGMSGLHGILAWSVFAPVAVFVIFAILNPVFHRLQSRIGSRREERE